MYEEINQLMVKFLDELFYKDNPNKELFNEIIEKNIMLEKRGYSNPKLNSAENLDFIAFRKFIYELAMQEKTYENVKIEYHSYKKTMVIDSILDYKNTIDIINSSPELFCRENVNNEDLKENLVYLDYNVFITCEENFNIREKILAKNDVQFYYSPAHVEEIFKRKQIENHESILNLLGEITNNIGIFFVEGNKLVFQKEKPNFSYIRTAICGKELNENVEEYRLLVDGDKTILQPKYKEQKHTSFINSRDLLLDEEARKMFDFALRKYGMNMGLSDFEKLEADEVLTKSYSYLNSCIYSIMNAMMFLSYKADKSEKTVRSGLYDVEHLIYGVKCNTFITNDRKFAKRAKIVYKLLKLNINVVHQNEYFEMQD
ncbi:hypothetical protein FDB52_14505 [Clostridium botulinum]|nr:hypothetical protein [Clostridium botulinum]NFN49726.1 hypothetical protein [Clostridium botulinum]